MSHCRFFNGRPSHRLLRPHLRTQLRPSLQSFKLHPNSIKYLQTRFLLHNPQSRPQIHHSQLVPEVFCRTTQAPRFHLRREDCLYVNGVSRPKSRNAYQNRRPKSTNLRGPNPEDQRKPSREIPPHFHRNEIVTNTFLLELRRINRNSSGDSSPTSQDLSELLLIIFLLRNRNPNPKPKSNPLFP